MERAPTFAPEGEQFSGTWSAAQPLLEAAVADGLCSHAFAAHFDARKISHCANTDAWFDLGSLTKPLATAVLMLKAIEAGTVAMDWDIKQRFHANTRGPVLLWHLLSHTGGMAAFDHSSDASMDFGRWQPERVLAGLMPRHSWVHKQAESWWLRPAGATTEYSDLGYILLGALLEEMHGIELSAIFAKTIADPKDEIAFGQQLPAKARLVRNVHHGLRQDAPAAVVHDPTAAMMGGEAGHAGLWATGKGLVSTVQNFMLMQQQPWFALWTQVPNWCENCHFTLGWDRPSAPYTCGPDHPDDSIGHLSFTGCSLWWSPREQVGSLLLTNRSAMLKAGLEISENQRRQMNALRSEVHQLGWAERGGE